jgi:hypothetical protein
MSTRVMVDLHLLKINHNCSPHMKHSAAQPSLITAGVWILEMGGHGQGQSNGADPHVKL